MILTNTDLVVYGSIVGGQIIASFLMTATIHAASSHKVTKFVIIAGLADLVKWLVLAGVTKQIMAGDYICIAAAIAGSSIGNYLAMVINNRFKRIAT